MTRLAWASTTAGVQVARRGRSVVGRVERVEHRGREAWAAIVVRDGVETAAGVWATAEGAKRGVESRVG